LKLAVLGFCALVSPLVVVADPVREHQLAATSSSGELVDQYLTFYGWPDNDPPGNALAYPRRSNTGAVHNTAGGTGTYEDPVSMATDPSEWQVGTRFYIPFLQKYVVMEDWCAGCVRNWRQQRRHHIDVWMNSNARVNRSALVDCQHRWTRPSVPTELNPPPDRTVDLRPLFDTTTNTCLDDVSVGPADLRLDRLALRPSSYR